MWPLSLRWGGGKALPYMICLIHSEQCFSQEAEDEMMRIYQRMLKIEDSIGKQICESSDNINKRERGRDITE